MNDRQQRALDDGMALAAGIMMGWAFDWAPIVGIIPITAWKLWRYR